MRDSSSRLTRAESKILYIDGNKQTSPRDVHEHLRDITFDLWLNEIITLCVTPSNFPNMFEDESIGDRIAELIKNSNDFSKSLKNQTIDSIIINEGKLILKFPNVSIRNFTVDQLALIRYDGKPLHICTSQ